MKFFLKFIFSISLIIIFIIVYLSLIGFETSKFNNQISNSVKKIDQNLDIELRKIKIILNPINLNFSAKTVGPKITNKKETLDFEFIKTEIPLKAILNDEFLIEKIEISTKSLDLKKVVSFSRVFKKNVELYFLESFIKKGFLIAKINLEFNNDGKIKDNYKINGIVRDIKIDVFEKYKFDKLNFEFDFEKEKYNFKKINLTLNDLLFQSNKVVVKDINKNFFISGQVENEKIDLSQNQRDLFIKPLVKNLDLDKLKFSSNNNFSFKIDKKFNFNDFELESKIKLESLSILNYQKLKILFPKLNNKLQLIDHELLIRFKKDNLSIDGSGDILLQNNNDEIKYSINKKKEAYNFFSNLKVKKNPVKLDFFDYEKNEENILNFTIEGFKKLDDQINFSLVSLDDKENKIEIKNAIINKDKKIIDLENLSINLIDKNNKFDITKKNNNYHLKGPVFNADRTVQQILSSTKIGNNPDDFFKINKDFLTFRINNLYPFMMHPAEKTIDIDSAEPLVYDKRLGHSINFQHLPPRTRSGKKYGNYQRYCKDA